MLPASGGEKPSATGDTRFASPATIDARGASASDAVELLAVAVDVEVHDRHARDLDGMGDAAELRLADDVLAEVARRLASEDRVRLAREGRAQQSVMERRDGPGADGKQRASRDRALACIPLQPSRCGSAQTGSSCRQTTSGRSRVTSSIICARNARRPGGEGLPWKRFQVRTSMATA